jgi:hypothetical protein
VTIRNPNPFALSGGAEVVSGLETWPASLVGAVSRWQIAPRVEPFTVEAEAENVVRFAINPAAPQAWEESFWAVVRLAYDGRVSYHAEPAP